MKRKHRHLIAVLVAIGVFCSPFTLQPAQATGSYAGSDEAALLEAREQNELALSSVREEINTYKAQYNSLQTRLDTLHEANIGAQEDYEQLTLELSIAQEQLNRAIVSYEQAASDLREQEELYYERIITMLPFRNKSTFEVLLDSDDMTGFFTTMRLMDFIAVSDANAIQNLEFAKETADFARDQAEATAADAEAFSYYAEEQLARYADQIALIEIDLESAEGQLLNRSAGLNSLEEEGAEIDQKLEAFYAQLREEAAAAELAAAQEAEEAARLSAQAEEAPVPAAGEQDSPATQEPINVQPPSSQQPSQTESTRVTQSAATTQPPTTSTEQSSTTTQQQTTTTQQQTTAVPPTEAPPTQAPVVEVGSPMLWPLASYNYISAGFGYYDPFGTGVRMHNGIDFAANVGTPVRAAYSGTVIIASAPYQGQNTGGYGYGNYVTILHNNGMSTTYAHLRDVAVSSGAQISQGDYLGTVGSTGSSTGPHLHFEVAVSGYRTDPMIYLNSGIR